jgi:hypothetical protein
MGKSGTISRRRFLAGMAATAAFGLIPNAAQAFGERSLFRMPSLVYGGSWDTRSGAQGRLGWELMKRTSIEASLEPGQVSLDDPDLFDTPVLYMAGDAAFEPFSDEQLGRLQRFLVYGGFLFIDGNPASGDGFDASVRAMLARLFPETPLKTLPAEHTLFKSFYLLDGRWGRVQQKSFVEGVSRDGRTMVVYSQNDVGGAWLRDNFGNWLLPVTPGGEGQREMAFRFGVNLAMYALCTNYKADQVHIPFIMRRRRR